MKPYFPDMTPTMCEQVEGFSKETREDQLKILAMLNLIMTSDSRYRAIVSGRSGAIVGKKKLVQIFEQRRCYDKLLPKYFYGLQGSNKLGRPNIYIPKDQLLSAYRDAITRSNLPLISNDGVRFRSNLKRNTVPVRRTSSHLHSIPKASNNLEINRVGLVHSLSQPMCPSCETFVLRLLSLSGDMNNFGSIPINYERKWNGRLYDVMSVQNTPKWIKHVALSGYFDYDIENCHYTLFEQLCGRIGINTPHVNDYSTNRKIRRQEISQYLGLPPTDSNIKRVKTALISVIYGSQESHWREGAIATALDSEDLAEKFNAYPLIKNIRGEVRSFSRELLESSKGKNHNDGVWTIKGGNSLIYKTRLDSDRDYRSALSFLLTSHESQILDIVLRASHQIELCMHDGWISRSKMDIESLTERIHAESGFKVRIDESVLDGRITRFTCEHCAEVIPDECNRDKSQLDQWLTVDPTLLEGECRTTNGPRSASVGGLFVSSGKPALCSWSEAPPYPYFPSFFS